jgi:hypothetical protein
VPTRSRGSPAVRRRRAALGWRVADHEVTPGGLTILVLESTGAPAFASYDGVASVAPTNR